MLISSKGFIELFKLISCYIKWSCFCSYLFVGFFDVCWVEIGMVLLFYFLLGMYDFFGVLSCWIIEVLYVLLLLIFVMKLEK